MIVGVYILNIYIMTKYDVCDWYQEHMLIAREFLLGDQYKIVKEKDSAGDYCVISPTPSYWVVGFVGRSINDIKRNVSCSQNYHCLKYFISIFKYVIKDREKIWRYLEKLFVLAEKKLDSEELSGAAKAFAQEITENKALILEAWEIGEQKIAAGLEGGRE